MTDAEIQNVSAALHAECLAHGRDQIFMQDDLLALGAVPQNNVLLLAECINYLSQQALFRPMSKDGKACWKVLSNEDGAKFRTLTQDEGLVYSYIESSGREGIWVKIIRIKSNLHQAPLNKCLKSLEQKGFVKQVHSHRATGRRMYMLAGLQPPEEVSGGPFYTDGNLDEEFIIHACKLLEHQIAEKSWQQVPRKKRATFADEETGDRPRRSEHARSRESSSKSAWLPMPPGYTGYATVGYLTFAFNDSNLTDIKLKEDDVAQLLDLLYWDGRIEKVLGGQAFKTVRPDTRGNAFTGTPCGRCPVGDLCDDEGPVNTATCQYFPTWLGEHKGVA